MTNTAYSIDAVAPGRITFLDASVLATKPLLHLSAPNEVRMVRGTRCQTTKDLFNEFSAALQFPWYFGHNWDAFDECLHDLGEWMTNVGTLTVVIAESSEVLSLEKSRPEFEIFARVMLRNLEPDALDLEYPGQNYSRRVPISLVLVESADKLSDVVHKWTNSAP